MPMLMTMFQPDITQVPRALLNWSVKLAEGPACLHLQYVRLKRARSAESEDPALCLLDAALGHHGVSFSFRLAAPCAGLNRRRAP